MTYPDPVDQHSQPTPVSERDTDRDDLPAGWVETTLGELIELNPKNNAPDDMPAGFIPMNNVETSLNEVPTFEKRLWGDIKKGYTHFRSGDVLLGKITPCFENGKSCIPENLPNDIGAGSTEFFVCRPQHLGSPLCLDKSK